MNELIQKALSELETITGTTVSSSVSSQTRLGLYMHGINAS